MRADAVASTTSHPAFRDDSRSAPVSGWDGGVSRTDLGHAESGTFLRTRLDRANHVEPAAENRQRALSIFASSTGDSGPGPSEHPADRVKAFSCASGQRLQKQSAVREPPRRAKIRARSIRAVEWGLPIRRDVQRLSLAVANWCPSAKRYIVRSVEHHESSYSDWGGQMALTVKQMMEAANAAVPKITAAQAREMIEKGNTLVVDVRDAPEVEKSGKVAGAVHVSRGMLEFRADPESPYHDNNFSKDKTVILYCASGGRSALAGKVLKDMGYDEVYNVGAFKDWAEGGGAVERPG
jgi:rhodanese-related sulfurtransferase